MSDALPERLNELSEDTRTWLAELRDDELKTLKEVVKMPADDVRDAFKMVRDLRTVWRFVYWLILTVVAIFLGTVGLYENAVKVVGWFKGGPSS